MNQKSGKFFFSTLAAALLAAPAWLSTPEVAQTNSAAAEKARVTLADLFGDPAVAKGKGFEIKQSQLDAEIVRSKAPYVANGQTPPATLDWQAIDRLVAFQVLLSKATE